MRLLKEKAKQIFNEGSGKRTHKEMEKENPPDLISKANEEIPEKKATKPVAKK